MPVFVIGKTTAELFLGVCVCVRSCYIFWLVCLRVGFKVGARVGFRLSLNGWGQTMNVYESPHKDRSSRVCVCVSDPASISSVLIKFSLKKLDGMKVAKTSLRGLLASTTRGR